MQTRYTLFLIHTVHVHVHIHVYSSCSNATICKCICINQPLGAHFIIIQTSTALYNDFQADSTSLLIEPSIPHYKVLKMDGYNGKSVDSISLRSGNSAFAPSGWFMHAWSHIFSVFYSLWQVE